MSVREVVEKAIRQVLVAETEAVSLSNKLFSPDGLFNRLAQTDAERRAVAESRLFKQAQKRLSYLKQKEGAEFSLFARNAEDAASGKQALLKFERT